MIVSRIKQGREGIETSLDVLPTYLRIGVTGFVLNQSVEDRVNFHQRRQIIFGIVTEKVNSAGVGVEHPHALCQHQGSQAVFSGSPGGHKA